jgi:hypothetical protein
MLARLREDWADDRLRKIGGTRAVLEGETGFDTSGRDTAGVCCRREGRLMTDESDFSPDNVVFDGRLCQFHPSITLTSRGC